MAIEILSQLDVPAPPLADTEAARLGDIAGHGQTGAGYGVVYSLAETKTVATSPFHVALTVASDAIEISTVAFCNTNGAGMLTASIYEDGGYAGPVYRSNAGRDVANILNIPYLNAHGKKEIYIGIEGDSFGMNSPADIKMVIRYKPLQRGGAQ